MVDPEVDSELEDVSELVSDDDDEDDDSVDWPLPGRTGA